MHAGAQAGRGIRSAATICLVLLAGAWTEVWAQVPERGDRPMTRPSRARRRRAGQPLALSEKQIKDTLAFARKHYPQDAERLERLLRTDRAKAMPGLRNIHRVYVDSRRYGEEVAQAVIDQRKLSLEVYHAVREFGQTDDPTLRAKITERIKELLGKRFDLEQTIKEHEVAQLEQRIARLAEQVKARAGKRDRIIDSRLKRLFRPPTPATAPTTAPTTPRPAYPHRHGPHRVTARQFEEIMAFARKYMPELQTKLQAIRDKGTPRAQQLLWNVHEIVSEIRAMPEHVRRAAIDLRKANVVAMRKAEQAKKATDPAERDRLRQAVRESLVQQFKHEQIVREYEVKRLRGELAALQAKVRQRTRDRRAIIARQMDRVLWVRRPTPASSPAHP